MKKMIEFLDEDRERVMTGLKSAGTPEAAQKVLEKETDRLLLQYNEECTSVRVRDAAAGMMQAVRSSIPMLDSTGEARVWHSEGSGAGGSTAGTGNKRAGLSMILLGIGAALTAAAFFVPALSAGGSATVLSLMKMILLPAAGGGCLYGVGTGKGTGTERIEILIDPEKLWSSLRGALMVVDRNLEITREEEAVEHRKTLTARNSPGAFSGEEIELFSGLLEMADADNPQMASDIRYYLHRREVDVIEWSQQYSAWFEMLPSMSGKGPGGAGEVMTIRPALAQKGKLLKKGLAVR